MGRFSAAKMIGAIDAKFQRYYNMLIDLLDTGYMVESTINGQKIRIEITPKKILAIYLDGLQIGGIQLLDNRLTSTIEAMMGANDKRTFIRVGDDPAISNADFMYGWYSVTSAPPYTKRFKISEYNGGAELAAINDDNHFCYLDLRTYQTFNNGSVEGPVIDLKGLAVANGTGGYIEMTVPNGQGRYYKQINGQFIFNDLFDQTALDNYANNAAALAGGLPVGALYRTGGDPDVVCIVH